MMVQKYEKVRYREKEAIKVYLGVQKKKIQMKTHEANRVRALDDIDSGDKRWHVAQVELVEAKFGEETGLVLCVMCDM